MAMPSLGEWNYLPRIDPSTGKLTFKLSSPPHCVWNICTLGTFLLFVVWNYRLWSPAIPGRAPALTGEDSRFFVWNYRLWWPATSEPPLWPGKIPTFCCVWIYRLWSPAIPGRAPALTLLLARWRKVNSFCRLLVTRLRQLAVFTCATLDNHK